MDKLTLQSLLSQHLDEIFSRQKFPLFQKKALHRLSVCRTQALGGHSQYCEDGHLNGVWYNSCKHRSCPQCQGMAKEEWLINTQRVLLDCPHHHIIFTIPEELNVYWRFNRALMTDLLFQSVTETLKTFAKDSRYLGATPGMLQVLHTWGRSLSLHPHIHCLISHGGLDSDGNWVSPSKDSLFPQKPVMQVFRGKFRANLKKALEDGSLDLPPDRAKHQVLTLLNKLGRKDWVVYFCDRYDHASGVAKYLATYVKGGSFKNAQLSLTDGGEVCFRYQSHQTKRRETLTLAAEEFVQRMVQHVQPPRKPGVRYAGLYTSASRKRLNIARKALGQQEVSEKALLDWQEYLEGLGKELKCDICGKPLCRSEEVQAPSCSAA